eukprot:TRINITY_DN46879_c0_g1_i1.p2 TRINITY_DN46879_c0_g1~~TRINITY_DN46879_c0_g1_i1.p2  ORF type:complete len:125 (-),score=11.71 TRINITY_DN46879_c0_g1_i1:191-565(-)
MPAATMMYVRKRDMQPELFLVSQSNFFMAYLDITEDAPVVQDRSREWEELQDVLGATYPSYSVTRELGRGAHASVWLCEREAAANWSHESAAERLLAVKMARRSHAPATAQLTVNLVREMKNLR